MTGFVACLWLVLGPFCGLFYGHSIYLPKGTLN